ncbi:ubiquinol-cytochrome c reductase iron-sulfur subunit [Parvularcula sp. ZS-1/3]|uniref:Ubiquinol-cytochrome c reductase iron-sulfur subunit n=1 Tax=Parvularcula mediterranea TaxID=2732508 RepID=A0A7Y3RN14_9PROT|nr:ubiquinol-cytochrome c reductase iron-sulfur subunit [Parvularcula mediterranea]NNU16272.1 ubiquinol-cytochrome c reductase iron-sulfur subunit [Parvularcula mediterranea]
MSSTTEDQGELINQHRPKGDWVQPDSNEPTKREFIHLLAAGTAAAAGAGIVIPLVSQLAPDAAVRALAQKEVSVAGVEPGQAVKTIWQGKPVFIRRLTEDEQATDDGVAMATLKDAQARNDNIGTADATLENRIQQGGFVVVLGVCTHLGCVPLGTETGENRGDFGGWFCPCHGSHYDSLGRIRKGPAPTNLPVPPLEFLSETNIRLG